MTPGSTPLQFDCSLILNGSTSVLLPKCLVARSQFLFILCSFSGSGSKIPMCLFLGPTCSHCLLIEGQMGGQKLGPLLTIAITGCFHPISRSGSLASLPKVVPFQQAAQTLPVTADANGTTLNEVKVVGLKSQRWCITGKLMRNIQLVKLENLKITLDQTCMYLTFNHIYSKPNRLSKLSGDVYPIYTYLHIHS